MPSECFCSYMVDSKHVQITPDDYRKPLNDNKTKNTKKA